MRLLILLIAGAISMSLAGCKSEVVQCMESVDQWRNGIFTESKALENQIQEIFAVVFISKGSREAIATTMINDPGYIRQPFPPDASIDQIIAQASYGSPSIENGTFAIDRTIPIDMNFRNTRDFEKYKALITQANNLIERRNMLLSQLHTYSERIKNCKSAR